MLKIYISLPVFSIFVLKEANSENWVLHQFVPLWFIFFLEFDHSNIETIKIDESRNNECTYLRFDIFSNNHLAPEVKLSKLSFDEYIQNLMSCLLTFLVYSSKRWHAKETAIVKLFLFTLVFLTVILWWTDNRHSNPCS